MAIDWTGWTWLRECGHRLTFHRNAVRLVGWRDNTTMEQRYVFYVSVGANLTAKVRAARKTVRAMGAKVVKTGAGTMLVEATPVAAADMAGHCQNGDMPSRASPQRSLSKDR